MFLVSHQPNPLSVFPKDMPIAYHRWMASALANVSVREVARRAQDLDWVSLMIYKQHSIWLSLWRTFPYVKWHGGRKAQIAAFHHLSVSNWPQSYAATQLLCGHCGGISSSIDRLTGSCRKMGSLVAHPVGTPRGPRAPDTQLRQGYVIAAIEGDRTYP
jgi:hypothetical protein